MVHVSIIWVWALRIRDNNIMWDIQVYINDIYTEQVAILNYCTLLQTVASCIKDINSRLAKRPLVFNGRLANLVFTTLVKEATGDKTS